MSLTKQDLKDIRIVVLDAIDFAVTPRLETLEAKVSNLESEFRSFKSEVNARLYNIESQLDTVDGRLKAVEADVKELYLLASKKLSFDFGSKKYQKLPNHKKIQILDREISLVAKDLGIALHR